MHRCAPLTLPRRSSKSRAEQNKELRILDCGFWIVKGRAREGLPSLKTSHLTVKRQKTLSQGESKRGASLSHIPPPNCIDVYPIQNRKSKISNPPPPHPRAGDRPGCGVPAICVWAGAAARAVGL